jgi:hypothetical protein
MGVKVIIPMFKARADVVLLDDAFQRGSMRLRPAPSWISYIRKTIARSAAPISCST